MGFLLREKPAGYPQGNDPPKKESVPGVVGDKGLFGVGDQKGIGLGAKRAKNAARNLDAQPKKGTAQTKSAAKKILTSAKGGGGDSAYQSRVSKPETDSGDGGYAVDKGERIKSIIVVLHGGRGQSKTLDVGGGKQKGQVGSIQKKSLVSKQNKKKG